MRIYTETVAVRSALGRILGVHDADTRHEDQLRLARLIARLLKEEGYSAEAALDGRSGLSHALAGPFGPLTVYWMFPDLEGFRSREECGHPK